MIRSRPQDGETPYDVAGKNLKMRKLIQALMDAQLDDNEEAAGGDDEEEEEEWEEADEEEAVATAAK